MSVPHDAGERRVAEALRERGWNVLRGRGELNVSPPMSDLTDYRAIMPTNAHYDSSAVPQAKAVL